MATESWPTMKGDNLVVQPPPIPVPVEPRPHPSGNGEVLVVRDGYKAVELRGRQRGRRCHVFDDLASFAEWLNRHAGEQAERCEILVARGAITAALDPADAQGDVIACELPLHPTFDAWTDAMEEGVTLNQATLHRLVIAQAESLGAQAQGFAAALLQLKLATQGDFTAELDPLGYARVAGGTNRQEATVKLPPSFTISTPIFDGVRTVAKVEVGTISAEAPVAPEQVAVGIGEEVHYQLELFLTLEIVGEEAKKRAVFRLDCPALPRAMAQARRDAAAYLGALLKPGFLVGLGEYGAQTVPDVS